MPDVLGGLRRALGAALALALMLTLGSCAYYNTMFMAKRYYNQATLGAPYLVDKPDPSQAQNFNKSVDYCKKLLGSYPKSKWVDDATLLWARGLIGKDDPGAALEMLRGFSARYPNTPLRAEATFYLGLSSRLTHKYTEAVTAFEDSRRISPRGDMVPYAYLEESRALMSLHRYDEAAAIADTLIERFEKHPLHDRALLTRADARLALGDYQQARDDYRTLGGRAANDDDRFRWLLKEADCLEAGHDGEASLVLLRDALSHEKEPVLSDTTGKLGFIPVNLSGGADRWGLLKLRIGGAYTLMGRQQEALGAFDDVMVHYWRTPLAAEAQYRKGYVYEVVADDFATARLEYGKVRDQSVSSVFAVQANQRAANLDRLAQFRVAGGDSVAKDAEASFMRAELYLFQNDKPQRAMDEYRGVSERFPGTGWDAKALLAQAWVKRTRMRDTTGADSLLWAIVNQHPATEAQLAARDYLEQRGAEVPDSLIKMPERPLLAADTTRLTPPPGGDMPLGTTSPAAMDSTLRLGMRGSLYGGAADPRLRVDAGIDSLSRAAASTDSLARVQQAAIPDTSAKVIASVRADSVAAARARATAPRDTTGPGTTPAPAVPPAPMGEPVPALPPGIAKPDSLP